MRDDLKAEVYSSMHDKEYLSWMKQMRDMGISGLSISGYGIARDGKEDSNKKVVNSELPDLFDNLVERAKRMEELADMLDREKNYLLQSALAVRNQYRPDSRDEILKLVGIAKSKAEDGDSSSEIESLFLRIVGNDSLRGKLVGFSVSYVNTSDVIVVKFGIKNKPTRCAVSIPIETEYENRNYEIGRMFDNYLDDGLDGKVLGCDVGFVKKRDMRVRLFISAGVSSGEGDQVCVRVDSLSEVGSRIFKAIEIDAREQLRTFKCVSECLNASDLSEWRMRRRADVRAAENA